jgi:glyoxylase-like metal-dependent hydrolase (beta-lactamase superfamily II)
MLKIEDFFDYTTSTWSYVIWDPETNLTAIIDPVLDFDFFSGKVWHDSANKIIDFIEANNLKLQWIIETHAHADHLTSSQYIKSKLGGKIAINKKILDIIPTWKNIFEIEIPENGSQFDYLFDEAEKFKIGNIKGTVINTPGHTPADSCIIIEDNIFTGDTIFLPDVGTGRCDFPGGSAEDSYNSCQKLLSFPDNYKIYVGHDYPPSDSRKPQSNCLVKDQKEKNIRVNKNISKEEFITKRNLDDKGKAVPKLLLPSIQFNILAGNFAKITNSKKDFVKIPINLFG